jgi:hypothetical protein
MPSGMGIHLGRNRFSPLSAGSRTDAVPAMISRATIQTLRQRYMLDRMEQAADAEKEALRASSIDYRM